jgi:hypothetical protein
MWIPKENKYRNWLQSCPNVEPHRCGSRYFSYYHNPKPMKDGISHECKELEVIFIPLQETLF